MNFNTTKFEEYEDEIIGGYSSFISAILIIIALYIISLMILLFYREKNNTDNNKLAFIGMSLLYTFMILTIIPFIPFIIWINYYLNIHKYFSNHIIKLITKKKTKYTLIDLPY